MKYVFFSVHFYINILNRDMRLLLEHRIISEFFFFSIVFTHREAFFLPA